jgi:hypothetical protein
VNLGDSIAEVNGFGEAPGTAGERRTIPFDQAFRYTLEGVRDTVHNSTLTVSIEAAFTAVSIGYGVVPNVSPRRFGFLPKSVLEDIRRTPDDTAPPRSLVSFLQNPVWAIIDELRNRVTPPSPDITLTLFRPTAAAAAAASPRSLSALVQEVASQLFTTSVLSSVAETLSEEIKAGASLGSGTAEVLQSGFRVSPEFFEKITIALASGRALDPAILEEAFEAVAAPPDQVQFLYSIFDDGTGREFQSEPILNTAGLGTADGTRPFRYFARPIEFGPRSTIRMQVIEKSEFRGELHVSLQGYKTLGTPGSPTGQRPAQARRLRRIR